MADTKKTINDLTTTSASGSAVNVMVQGTSSSTMEKMSGQNFVSGALDADAVMAVDETPASPAPLNADQLNGHADSYFASKAYVDSEISALIVDVPYTLMHCEIPSGRTIVAKRMGNLLVVSGIVLPTESIAYGTEFISFSNVVFASDTMDVLLFNFSSQHFEVGYTGSGHKISANSTLSSGQLYCFTVIIPLSSWS